MFWGLILSPGLSYSQTVNDGFVVTMAALGESKQDGSTAVVMMEQKNSSYVLCKLVAGETDQQRLTISLTEGENIKFWIEGSVGVHLTGYHHPPEDDVDEDLDDSEDELEDNLGDEEEDSEDDESDLEEEEADQEEDQEEQQATVKPKPAANRKRKIDSSPEVAETKKTKTSQMEQKKLQRQQQQQQQQQLKQQQKEKAEKSVKVKESKQDPKELQKQQQQQQKEKEMKKKQEQKPLEVKHVKGVGIVEVKVGSGKVASNGKKVKVEYAGRLKKSGKQFDAGSIDFKLGANQVISGWDIGVQGMKIGGARRLIIPSQHGYGKRGAPPDIPPNATLVFDVKLLAVR